jgi:phosphopantothenoylcysteine decarboxylase
MPNILLGTTGSVAAVRTPALYQRLVQSGFQVKVVATQASLYFFDPAELTPSSQQKRTRDPEKVILDEDEWSRRNTGQRYQRDDLVLHIELRRWADLFLLAPLDANTLAKLAHGLADNCLTCVWRAWDPAGTIILAPAMNTMMWDHPLTGQHFRLLAEAMGVDPIPASLNLEKVIERINQQSKRLHIIAPQSKRLACGDIGMGALAELDDIVAAVNDQLGSPARSKLDHKEEAV